MRYDLFLQRIFAVGIVGDISKTIDIERKKRWSKAICGEGLHWIPG
jgi:hypothetical protein